MKKLLFVLLALVLSGCLSPGDDDAKVADEVSNEPVVLECGADTLYFAVEGTPIQFCYLPAWGEPKVEAMPAVVGSNTRISFADMAKSPTMWFETTEFQIGDGGIKPFDFSALGVSMYATDEQIAAKIAEIMNLSPNNLNARKGDIAGKRAARVHYDYYSPLSGKIDELVFYVPEAFAGYNMILSAPYSIAGEFEDFIYGMVF